jgi:hypothetical protein
MDVGEENNQTTKLCDGVVHRIYQIQPNMNFPAILSQMAAPAGQDRQHVSAAYGHKLHNPLFLIVTFGFLSLFFFFFFLAMQFFNVKSDEMICIFLKIL